jgi:hypothetical protein
MNRHLGNDGFSFGGGLGCGADWPNRIAAMRLLHQGFGQLEDWSDEVVCTHSEGAEVCTATMIFVRPTRRTVRVGFRGTLWFGFRKAADQFAQAHFVGDLFTGTDVFLEEGGH